MKSAKPRQLTFYLGLISALLICGYLGFALGSLHEAAQQTRINTLQHTVENLQEENDELTRDLNVLGVELEVQKLTVKQTQEQVVAQKEQQASLERELAFYQRVMAPELTQQGFVIEGLQFTPTSLSGFYRFELVLLQQDQIKNVVNGTINMVLEGSIDGKPARYNANDLLQEQESIADFSFKYFQLVDGVVALPEGFTPERVTVSTEIFQFRRKRGDLTRAFFWRDIQNT